MLSLHLPECRRPLKKVYFVILRCKSKQLITEPFKIPFRFEDQKSESRGLKSESTGQEFEPRSVNMNCNLRDSKIDSGQSVP